MDPADTQHVQIRMVLEASVEMDTILDYNKAVPRLSADDYRDFRKAGFTMLLMFNALAKWYSEVRTPALKLFDITVKAHYLAHAVLMASVLNPRLGWCYAGEDITTDSNMSFSSMCAESLNMLASLGKSYKLSLQDFMQSCRRLLASCCKGSGPALATKTMMRRYSVGLHHEFFKCK